MQVWGQNAVGFDGMTTHRQDFVQHPLEGRPHYGPPAHAGNTLPFDGTSTYASEFPAHPMPARDARPPAQYQPSDAPFDGTTTYKTNYIPHPMERAAPRGGPHGERVSLPFDGQTSYRNDFTAHPLPERQVAAGGPYQPAHVPFDAASTYKGDYVQHPYEPRPQGMTSANARPSLPFDGTTTYSDYFKPFPVQPHVAGAARPGNYQLNGARFEGMSETMDKYRAWAVDPSNRHGHGPPPMRPSLPFDGTTTHREMFKGWQLPPKRPALGVQMVGDVAYVLIPANAAVPAVGRQVFTTVHDNQTEMSVLVLEGDFTQASRCSVLGQFDFQGLPPGPKGMAKLEVTFHVDQNGVLNVAACDLNSQRQEQWLREGYLVAHSNPNP